ncbi:MAG: LCP family protein [Defluviitaleaceae bacterium]|nr:LCP family protein [Defluviitaleaceae bacterium]
MSDKNQNRIHKPHGTSRRMRILLKSFSITLGAIAVMVVAGILLWNRTVAPPPPPPMEAIRLPVTPSVPVERTTDDQDEDPEEVEYEYVWPAPERFTDEDRRDDFWTFLIIGLNEGQNANTVMVASYDGALKEANLISIPRDVIVHPTRVGRRLASSYIAGSGGGRGREGGIAQVQRDVMNVIGFVPDFYVVIDYDAFFTIIDAVGGIYIDVPQRMRYVDEYQDLDIDLHPGLQHMDSETALQFVRFRQGTRGTNYPGLPRGDFDRVRNQQIVIEEVVNRLLRPQSLLQIPEFVEIFNDSVDTNLTIPNMMYFALELNSVRGTDALSSYTLLPSRSSGHPTYEEFLSPQVVLELVNRTINPFEHALELRDLNVVTQ